MFGGSDLPTSRETESMQNSPARTILAATAAWNSSAMAIGSALAGRTARAWSGPAAAEAPPSLGRMGSLDVRLAVGRKEVRRAQRLRYKVFFEHGSAVPSQSAALHRRDLCAFDAVCDHLVVIDHDALDRHLGGRRPKIVGTYRLLRQEMAERHFGFYTAREFDIAPLLARHPGKRFLELGRSCVLPRYRSKRTIELLWRGIWAYVQSHGVDVLIGCASLDGCDPDALVVPLSALRHYAQAEPAWQARPLPGRAALTTLIPAEALDRRDALARLPPLVKGYLRAGARFGEGVVVDHAFGTTDVLAVLPLDDLDGRYRRRFGSA